MKNLKQPILALALILPLFLLVKISFAAWPTPPAGKTEGGWVGEVFDVSKTDSLIINEKKPVGIGKETPLIGLHMGKESVVKNKGLDGILGTTDDANLLGIAIGDEIGGTYYGAYWGAAWSTDNAANDFGFYLGSQFGTDGGGSAVGTYPFYITNNYAKITLLPDNRVGIGTLTPDAGYRLHVKGAILAESEASSGGYAGIAMKLNGAVNGAVYYDSAIGNNLLIANFNGGDVKIVNNRMKIGGENYFYGDGNNLAARTDAGAFFIQNKAGTDYRDLYARTVFGVNHQYSSDKRLKKEIKPLEGALEKIKQISGVSFEWKNSSEKQIGLIAQDVEKVFPELIMENPETGMKSVAYANLVAPLIEAIKTQQLQIEHLEKRIQKLEKN